jgi:formylglycine-generating enzyme required for sulfatase activity
VRRYRGRIVAGSAVFATAVVGAVVALQFALREREKVRQFDLLSGVVLYDRAIEAEKELYPPWPHKIAAMEKWLREDCGQLLAMRPEIERRVVGLRAVALPATPAEIDQDRRLHPRFGEWALLQKRVSALNRAQAVREGRQELEVPALPFDMRERAASDLNDLAWDRVAPKPDERKTYGDEALGLALAKAALARVEAGDNSVEPCAVLDTLAWALFQNGRDDEARQRSAAALALAPVDERDGTRGNDNDLAQSIAEARGTLMAAEKRLRTLTEETSERRTFTFADDARRFLHDAVTDLRARLDGLAAKEKPAVEQQLAWARRIDELTRHHPNARVTWEAAAEAIAKADQVAASELYRAHPIEHLPPQMGLVPIGRNPRTKLWEFYELRSAWDGKSDPATIAIPEHREDGSIEVAAETGIVFVLLPGGVFTMGAQSQDEDKANFDARAKNDETPQRITLAPFLMARHELTRAQWQRLTGTSPFWFKENTTVGYEGDPIPIGPSHPAESMSANEASLWMERHGLVLPTEAQWEYACRAVTTTPWWPGREEADLEGAANVHDRTSFSRQPQWGTSTPIEDGFTAIAPVGSFRANAFGLFDTHGNLFEMCRDWYSIHGIAWQPVDGLRLGGESSGFRVCRGGSYADHSVGARCAFRQPLSPSMATQQTGIRVARTLELEP